jgi:hypothetical protein
MGLTIIYKGFNTWAGFLKRCLRGSTERKDSLNFVILNLAPRSELANSKTQGAGRLNEDYSTI